MKRTSRQSLSALPGFRVGGHIPRACALGYNSVAPSGLVAPPAAVQDPVPHQRREGFGPREKPQNYSLGSFDDTGIFDNIRLWAETKSFRPRSCV